MRHATLRASVCHNEYRRLRRSGVRAQPSSLRNEIARPDGRFLKSSGEGCSVADARDAGIAFVMMVNDRFNVRH